MEDLLATLEQEMRNDQRLRRIDKVFMLDVPVPIDTIVIHISPHLDELAAMFIAKRCGAKKFPGIEGAKVSYTRGDLKNSESSYWTKGVLPFGTGDGFKFNDHVVDPKDLTKSHLPDDCSCTLVAKYLRVDRDPELRRLLREVLACDRTADTTPTMLASVIKTDNSRRDWSDRAESSRLVHMIVEYSRIALTAIVEYETKPAGPREGEKTLKDFLNAWLAEREENEGKIQSKINSYLVEIVDASMKEKDTTVTELAHIVEAMSRTAKPGESMDGVNERIADWLQYAFEAILINQMDFWKEVDRVRRMQPISVKARIDGVDDVLRMVIIDNGGPNSQRAGRYCSNDIVVVYSKKGGFGEFLSDKARKVGLSNLVPMTRILESHSRKTGRVFKRWEWPTLARAGIHAAANNLYYFREAEMLFNGSSTSDAEPSKISRIRLISANRHAFHPDFVEIWKDREFGPERRARG